MARRKAESASAKEGESEAEEPRRRRPRTTGASRASQASRKQRAPVKGRLPVWLRGWPGVALFGAAGLVVLYVAYALFVSVSDGTFVEMRIEVGRGADGQAFLHCGAQSSPGVCSGDPGNGTALFTVESRDRVHVTVVVTEGVAGNHTLRLMGDTYALWPAGFRLDLGECAGVAPGMVCASTSFTAWAEGRHDIATQDGSDPDLKGTLVVL